MTKTPATSVMRIGSPPAPPLRKHEENLHEVQYGEPLPDVFFAHQGTIAFLDFRPPLADLRKLARGPEGSGLGNPKMKPRRVEAETRASSHALTK
jgi:hypothetical protein